MIHYLDDQLLRVFRRYEKRLPEEQRTASAVPDDAPGYENMEQVIADLDPLVDVVWISHTRESTILPPCALSDESVGPAIVRNVNTAGRA